MMNADFRLFLRRILFMIRKELLTTIKDPKSRFILLAPALVQSILFGYVASYNLDKVPYAVLDQSRSSYSAKLLAKLDGSGIFKRVRTLDNSNQIAASIDAGDAVLILSIGPEFAAQIVAGQTAPLQVITDGRNTMTSGLASAYISTIVAAYNQQLQGGHALINVKTITWYNPNQITRWGFLASLVALISFAQVIFLAGLSVARERENGTFDQLLVTPLTPLQILIGKAIPPILIGLIQSTIVLAVSVFWFHVHVAGSLFTLYLTLFIFLLSCVGLGLSISAISQNMQQVIVYSFVVLMPLILLSGLATPVNNMPEALQWFTYIDPLRFAIDCVRRIYLEGASFVTIAPQFIPMLAVASITLPMAGWLFRNKLS